MASNTEEQGLRVWAAATWRWAEQEDGDGRPEPAAEGFRAIAAAMPERPEPIDRLAAASRAAGASAQAIILARRAFAMAPDNAILNNNLAAALDHSGQVEAALGHYARALLLVPELGGIEANRAAALGRIGRTMEAISGYRRSLAIAPDDPGLMFDLAATLDAVKAKGAAIRLYRRILSKHPGHEPARQNLALARALRGDEVGGRRELHRMLILNPGLAPVWRQLGVWAHNAEQPDRAVRLHRRALRLDDSDLATWRALGDAGRRFTPDRPNPGIVEDFVTCAEAGRVWPALLGLPLLALLRIEPAVQGALAELAATTPQTLADRLAAVGPPEALSRSAVRRLLATLLLPDVDFERALTHLRAGLLVLTARGGLDKSVEKHERLGSFLIALALHCGLNEHAYFESEMETVLLEQLLAPENLDAASPLGLVLLSCYRSPASLPALAQRAVVAWHQVPGLAVLRHRTIEGPAAEQRIAEHIPALTPIDDQTSQAVKSQYEENPYPRWSVAQEVEGEVFGSWLRRHFPNEPDRFIEMPEAPDALIAGCGTGQQAIALARRHPNAQILAVDLSRTSLAYARHQAERLDVPGVEFAQADIACLGDLERRFDLIESVGVLHHMADPEAGLQVLSRLLRPGGIMQIALYSELGRAPVVAVRQKIAEWELTPSPDGIRETRRRIAGEARSPLFEGILISADFYAMSSCRDLLFHSHEDRFTIPRIAKALDSLGLQFLGFDLPRGGDAGFSVRFGKDADTLDLTKWDTLETEFPNVFAAMYRFWVRKA
ncbi:MAG: methyltransferase domain-containing protein [Rhodospirillaceae bacterium]|nr:methyltransferase domain-containing protein [Rhodospirillaceae bacterium]